MLKILQARLQQYMTCELPDIQAGFRKGRGTRDQVANICWITEKAREFQNNIYFCFIDYAKAFDSVCVCVCARERERERKRERVAQSCPTLCNPMYCSLPRSSIHGMNTGVGCHFLLQRIFPTQGSNLGLLHSRQTL